MKKTPIRKNNNQAWNCTSLIFASCLWLLFNTTLLSAEKNDVKLEDLINLIQKDNEQNTKKKIKIQHNNKNIYAQYQGHNETSITFLYRDQEFHYDWNAFRTNDLLDILESFEITGSGYLVLARYCLTQHLPKLAKRYCSKAKRKNSDLKNEAATLLQTIKDYEKDRKKSRYNHDNRKLPPLPKVSKPILFNTPEADRIMSSIQLFPKNNPWNTDISTFPVHPDSDKILKKIGLNTPIRYDLSHNFIIVPPNQKKIPVKITNAVKESSTGPAPIPANMPIEGWPKFWDKNPISLKQHQTANDGGDRHGYILDPWNNMLYEFFHMKKTNDGWQAYSATYWRLDKNQVLPDNYTSADAAGLSLMAGIIRYDELERGKIEHAIRVTFKKTRKAFIYPASHHASNSNDPHLPAMGQRFRLKKNIDTSGMSKQALAIVYALQKYGAICADNGSDWFLSGVIDDRIDANKLKSLGRIKCSDFEVIQTTTPGK